MATGSVHNRLAPALAPNLSMSTFELFGSVVETVPGGVTGLLRRWVAAEMEILLAGAAP